MKEFLLMNCPSMEKMATEIANHEICKNYCERAPTRWDHFPDGYPNLFIQNASSLPGKRVVVLLSLFNKENVFEQISLIYALPRHSIRSLIMVLCYFPPGTMERVDLVGQVATAKSLCRMLSCTPPTSRGPPQLLIYDIHALQERFYFADSILPQLQSAMPLLADIINNRHDRNTISIAFPDEGAYKRFHKQLDSDLPTITCMKIRQGDSRKVSLMEGEPKGRHVFIIDDLVQSGGTLMGCKNLLLELGASRVSCFVTHAIFPNNSWVKFTEEDEKTRFDTFYVTNSCPEITNLIEGVAPFQVLSLAPSICNFLSEYI